MNRCGEATRVRAFRCIIAGRCASLGRFPRGFLSRQGAPVHGWFGSDVAVQIAPGRLACRGGAVSVTEPGGLSPQADRRRWPRGLAVGGRRMRGDQWIGWPVPCDDRRGQAPRLARCASRRRRPSGRKAPRPVPYHNPWLMDALPWRELCTNWKVPFFHIYWRFFSSKSRATSTIMSSWPPIILRRPSSMRMSRGSTPCWRAARSVWRRKEE